MSSVINNPKTRLDWYEVVCQRLDVLKDNSVKHADAEDVLPPCELYEVVKSFIQDLRQVTGFAILQTPDVWLGPDGQIGLTWESGDNDLELIFSKTNLLARKTCPEGEVRLDKKSLPVELVKFVA